MSSNEGSNKENGKGRFFLKKFIAAILICIVMTLFIIELLGVSTYVLPALASAVYNNGGLAALNAKTLGDITFHDFVAAMILWGLPCLSVTIFTGILHFKLACVMAKKIGAWFKLITEKRSDK